MDGLNNSKDLRQWSKRRVIQGLFLLIYHCILQHYGGYWRPWLYVCVCTNECMLWVCAFEVSKLTKPLWSLSILITASISGNHSIKTVCKKTYRPHQHICRRATTLCKNHQHVLSFNSVNQQKAVHYLKRRKGTRRENCSSALQHRNISQ